MDAVVVVAAFFSIAAGIPIDAVVISVASTARRRRRGGGGVRTNVIVATFPFPATAGCSRFINPVVRVHAVAGRAFGGTPVVRCVVVPHAILRRHDADAAGGGGGSSSVGGRRVDAIGFGDNFVRPAGCFRDDRASSAARQAECTNTLAIAATVVLCRWHGVELGVGVAGLLVASAAVDCSINV